MSGILKIRQAMKKKYLIAAALLAVCGCQKSNESPVVTGKADKIQAYVEDNADTKTIATQNGKSLDFVWAKGDKIGVVTASTDVNDWGYYDKNTKKYVPFEYTLDGEGGSKEGNFSTVNGTPNVDGAQYLAIYPSETISTITRDNWINIWYEIPVNQKYVENGFDTKYAVMCAISDSKENMVFKHYSSVLKLKVKAAAGFEGTKVTGIKVTAETNMPSICGSSYFQKEANGTSLRHMNVSGNSNKVINYSVPGVILSSKDETEFNIVFNPISSGDNVKDEDKVTFTIDINTDRGDIIKTKKLHVLRGVVYNMPVIEIGLKAQNLYFFNDGNTVAPNLSSFVEGTKDFTSLTIKPSGNVKKVTLAETDLAAISDYITKYGSETGVKLDLSQAYYISNVWPLTFRNNTKLQSIALPLNITEGSAGIDIKKNAAPFEGCTMLSEIILDEAMLKLPDHFLTGVPSIKTINLTKKVNNVVWLQGEDATANLENITVDSENTTFYAKDGVLYRIDNGVKGLEYVPAANTAALPNGVYTLPDDVINIHQAAFHRNKNISKIVVHKNFKAFRGGYVFSTKNELKVLDFSALKSVPTFTTTASLKLAKTNVGEIWCASDEMVKAFSEDPRWKTEATDNGWKFIVKPAATKSQAPAISNLNSSKPDFSWK